ncbi:MAG: hypothetical protein KU28_01345 [Sulfurovum sp. PC08-66]|nr:MAG: hypothetical protein KU28_01345 [Sulfurovum sp. PC08-66]KIM12595.1 MAG: hypothetical protein KU37_01460 [Sulfuricurvum sp. PC08-66]
MNILQSENWLTIEGVVKSFAEAQLLKDRIESITLHNKTVVLEFKDAYSLASTIIGYLNKKIHVDKVRVSMVVHQEELYELMQMLSLIQLFEVRRA